MTVQWKLVARRGQIGPQGNPGSGGGGGSSFAGTLLGSAKLETLFQVTDSAEHDIDGLYVSVLVGTRPIKVTFNSLISCATADQGSIVKLYEDPLGANTIIDIGTPVGHVANVGEGCTLILPRTPIPGVHVYKATLAKFGTGTAYIAATKTSPTTLIVEEM